MQAIKIQDDKLIWASHPDPGPLKADEVRIRIAWAGRNRADLMQRAGSYPPPSGASEAMGLEVSGWVEAVGADVSRFAVGDEVCAVLAGGGYGEQVVVSASHVLRVPEVPGLREAA